jgi:cytochrome P450
MSLPALQFIYMLVSIHPEVLEKLRLEHSHVFHPSVTGTFTMLQTAPHILNKLDYTTAVIKETLRLFPVGTGVRAAPHGYVSKKARRCSSYLT